VEKIKLEDLTLREKIAQCLCIPQFDLNNQTEVDRGQLRTEEERDRLVSEEQYGVVWCHGGQRFNALDMAELNWGVQVTSREYKSWVKSIEKNMKIPSLRTLDAESSGAGGSFSDLTKLPPWVVVGAANDEELAFKLGEAAGKEFRCAGLNWKWGPVVDLVNQFSASALRSFSQDPDKQIRLANAAIRGLQSVGVAATAKHFPGGDRITSGQDSHFTTTFLASTMEEWWAEQGRVFKAVIDAGVYTIMTSHKGFPACDNTKINGQYIPTTISKKVTTDLLKGELGFKGVVITDCINMGGLVSMLPHDELIVEIMKAGNDVILSCGIHDAEILEKAVLDGRLEESRIDDACQRVLDLKEKLGLFDEDYSIDYFQEPEELVPYHKELSYQAAQKAITLIRDNNNMLPLDKNKIKNVQIIVSTHRDGFVKDIDVLKEELEKRGMTVKVQRRLTSFAEIEKIAEENDLIIYAGFLAMHNPKGDMSFYAEECETFHFAFSSGKEKSIGVSFGYPYIYYKFMGNSNTCINAYSKTPSMMKAFAESIFGEIPMTGESPVPLNPIGREW